MRLRAARVLLLAFEIVWLNVIVPGHHRGVVSLPGEACPNCTALADSPLRCATCAKPHRDDSHPARDAAAHCAVCHFAARVTLPPVIDLTPPKLELLESQPMAAVATPLSIHHVLTYDGRAPPLV
jgi:hypothetical protein